MTFRFVFVMRTSFGDHSVFCDSTPFRDITAFLYITVRYKCSIFSLIFAQSQKYEYVWISTNSSTNISVCHIHFIVYVFYNRTVIYLIPNVFIRINQPYNLLRVHEQAIFIIPYLFNNIHGNCDTKSLSLLHGFVI